MNKIPGLQLIGARILKTGIAVSLAIYLCTLLNLEPKVFSAVSAVINVQPSIYRSFRNALEQILTHVVSVIIAVISGYALGTNPIVMGLTSILIIAANVKLKLVHGIAMGVVAGIFVLDAPQHDFLTHALTRSYVIFVGLASALLVNSLLPQPRYNRLVLKNLVDLNDQAAKFFEELVRGFITLDLISQEQFEQKRSKIKEHLRLTRSQFDLLKDQNKYLKGDSFKDQEVWEKYLDFSVRLFYKSVEIYSATQQRLQWRTERGDPPITTEFQSVLAMLERGIGSFAQLNHQLRQYILHGEPMPRVSPNEQFWEELSYFIDRWHTRMTGANFLHAFMYISVVANDIKWGNRTIKEFSLTAEPEYEKGPQLKNNG